MTICTHNHECFLGQVVDNVMRLNDYGRIVKEEWLRTAAIRSEVELDEFVVMPNHVHGVVVINQGRRPKVGAHGRAPLQFERKAKSLGSLIAGYKSAATKRINELRGTPNCPVWQRNYYEHVIRDEDELNRVREYVLDNPAKWLEDAENPNNV